MKIVVLAGGLSTERDVSFKTGDMVAKALRENGHQVILLDVFMGYSDKKEDLTGIFDRSEEVSVKVSGIPEIAPDLAKVKASRKDQSDNFFGPNVIELCQMSDIVFMALHGENGENGKIQAAFDRLARGRTTLVIAHRLSTIRNADEIVVIGEHGILERGTHAQLVAQGGVYAELAAGARLSGETE